MTTQEFIRYVDLLGGSTAAANAIGVSPSQISLYKKGTRNVGASMAARILQALEDRGLDSVIEANGNVAPSTTKFSHGNRVLVQYFEQRVNAGIGVAFDTSNRLFREVDASLVKNPDDGFCMNANGDSMIYAGILDGSFLVCERITHRNWGQLVGHIVIADVDGISYVKRLVHEDGIYKLRSESPRKYKDYVLTDDTNAVIRGIVKSIHTDTVPYKPHLIA